MNVDALKALVRAAGGVVHSDGNVFFTSLEQFAAAAGQTPSRLIAGYEVLSAPGAAVKVTRVNLTEEGRQALSARGLPALEPEIEDDCEGASAALRPLSDERIGAIVSGLPGGLLGYQKTWGWLHFARALEQAHGIGNDAPAAAIMAPPSVEWALAPSEPNEALLRPFYDCPPEELPNAYRAMLWIARVQRKRAQSEKNSNEEGRQ